MKIARGRGGEDGLPRPLAGPRNDAQRAGRGRRWGCGAAGQGATPHPPLRGTFPSRGMQTGDGLGRMIRPCLCVFDGGARGFVPGGAKKFQKNFKVPQKADGLPRRFAPRNDGRAFCGKRGRPGPLVRNDENRTLPTG